MDPILVEHDTTAESAFWAGVGVACMCISACFVGFLVVLVLNAR